MGDRKKRVLVAMSGGVDSSVAAALLVEQGYDVIGVTMQVWDYSATECSIEEGFGTCCSSTDVDDARNVADHLGIPFYVLNCEEKFQAYVIDDFLDSYLAGRTPVPCVQCNTFLKFDHLIQKMKQLDCDYLATGHYAQLRTGMDGEPAIFTSEDSWKDQTYFLFTLPKTTLPHLLFPVGNWEKPKLREYAEAKGLPVAHKKDSTGLCFIGKKTSYADFIEKNVAPDLIRGGEIKLYPSGKVIGTHEGVHRFTYGQRKGLGESFGSEPLYVVKLEPSKAVVWLGGKEHLFSRKVEIGQVQLLDDIKDGEELNIKIRFHHKGARARVRATLKSDASGKATESIELTRESSLFIEFEEDQRSVTPGQAAVLYRGQQLLGGGWIL